MNKYDGSLFESSSNTMSPNEREYIQRLLVDGLIEEKSYPYPFLIDLKPQSNGVSNVDWRLPISYEKNNSNKSIFKSLYCLVIVDFYLKFKGLYKTIQLLQKTSKKYSMYTIPDLCDLEQLAKALNKACTLYPGKVKCLKWAISFVLLALHRGWKCNLEIGIQGYPFLAHAWAECNEHVIMDSQNMREGMSIILREPFRKISI